MNLKDLKDALYGWYLRAGAPTLAEIVAEVEGLADALAEELRVEVEDVDALIGASPKRDTIARILGSQDVPPSQGDVVAVALARMAGQLPAHSGQRDIATIAERVRDLWVRARMAPPPPGAVRVRDARPRRLGVHAAIRVADGPSELPVYVPRDLDEDLRTVVSVGAEHGRFVLLVGGSSVGKTRTLFEVVRATLPDWWVVRPGSAAEIRTLAAAPTAQTVVWLDELQNHLDDGHGPAGPVRTLLHAGVVLVGTLWPREYAIRTARPRQEEHDRYGGDRELLELADGIRVANTLTSHERRRAEALASIDTRIRIALDSPDCGFTQVLAAGPELVARWEHAYDPYGKAVITAALDARRVGARAPLSRDLLAAAAPTYVTGADRATAPPDWLDRALAYATTELRGAAATLTPVAEDIGSITGYTVADYLHQHALRERRTEPLPDAAWQALVEA